MPMLLALASPASSIRLASDSAKVMDDRGMVYSLSSRYCQALRTEHTSSAWQPNRSRLQREKCYRHILSPACLNLGSRHRGSDRSAQVVGHEKFRCGATREERERRGDDGRRSKKTRGGQLEVGSLDLPDNGVRGEHARGHIPDRAGHFKSAAVAVANRCAAAGGIFVHQQEDACRRVEVAVDVDLPVTPDIDLVCIDLRGCGRQQEGGDQCEPARIARHMSLLARDLAPEREAGNGTSDGLYAQA